MKLLPMVLFLFASAVFANGVPSAYIGSGKLTISDQSRKFTTCSAGKHAFTSVLDIAGFDPGLYFSYALKVGDKKLVIAKHAVILRSKQLVLGGSNDGIVSGNSETYEDCPSRDSCEGSCCICEDSQRCDYTRQERPRLPISRYQKFPNRTDISLKKKDGSRVELSYVSGANRIDDITTLTGKITQVDGCVLTWQDSFSYGPIPSDWNPDRGGEM